MAVKYIKIENDQDLILLQRFISTLKAKAHADPARYVDHGESIYRLENSLANPVDKIDPNELKQEKPKARRKRRTKEEMNEDKAARPNLCAKHPTYGAGRIPSSDCSLCWKAYKKFHPMEYDSKRRAFIMKQKSKKTS
jgi:hypothetical protein